MSYPRVLVITSCTGEKQSKPENQLVLADFKDADRLRQREAELADFSTTAGAIILPLSNADAKRYRYGLVGLKGFLFKRFAEAVCKDAELLKAVYEEPTVFQEVIDQQETQLELTLGLSIPPTKKASKQVIKPSAEDYLAIPPCPPAPNVHLGMQYYIPEWDDRVDPNYDFLTDTLTPGRDP
ncbi:hypothetical protein [Leptolyngbya sp. 7M]|uniref:hypothetical protein n=1 Tax=Leptolyngbya sp. 7M TaxID=2812896 RepID=UPI001B8D1CF7|nr:hypothetical protein [Leptolyngbya sp. 7M]QYO67335.1 hypothetical protein JVX88_11335 [Leptolyngbya sp. 7M]